MKCKQCHDDFIPKQVYCSPACRLKSHRNGSVASETIALHKPAIETEALHTIDDDVSDRVIPKTKAVFNCSMCSKHKIFKGSCGCR